jgi:hypothetical protein
MNPLFTNATHVLTEYRRNIFLMPTHNEVAVMDNLTPFDGLIAAIYLRKPLPRGYLYNLEFSHYHMTLSPWLSYSEMEAYLSGAKWGGIHVNLHHGIGQGLILHITRQESQPILPREEREFEWHVFISTWRETGR